MTTLLEVCLVVATISFVAITATAIRAMNRFREASDELAKLSGEGRLLIERLAAVTRDTAEIVATLREAAPRVRSVVERIASIGERTAALSEAVAQEIEAPLRTAIALARGVRFGTQHLVEGWIERFASRSTANGEGRDPQRAPDSSLS